MDRKVIPLTSGTGQSNKIRGDFAPSIKTHGMRCVNVERENGSVILPEGQGFQLRVDPSSRGRHRSGIRSTSTPATKADGTIR